ncbi:hypothetical protein [Comamonas sp. 4034]|uniref:hypothetical protein n=1 Tax=Comamonas sp. 4034 TaxID=3156455 RepID=UPI003D1BC001
MDEQQQELAAFERGFAEASGLEPPAPVAPVAEVPQEPEVPTEPQEPEQQPEAPDAEGAEKTGETPVEKPPTEDDPELFEGFKRSELKRLVESASEVEPLKQRLRKAEGRVGELIGRLQQQPPAPQVQASQQAVVSVEDLPEIKQLEQDYPDVYRGIQALIKSQQPQAQAAPPVAPQEPVATVQAVEQAEPDQMFIELAVMDRTQPGWREKVQSQPFGSWLAAQGDETRQAFQAAQTAEALASVVDGYDKWIAGQQEAAEKAAKGQQRLQRAVTPTGSAQRPQAAPTEQEAMEAAFKRTLGQ